MTVLHVSDTHIGKTQYRSDTRTADFARAFDEAIKRAVEMDVNAVIHTGDLFDTPNPNTKAISNAMSSIKRLSDNSIPFLAIVGNHERKLEEQWLDIFSEFENVHRLSDEPFEIEGIAFYGIDAVRSPNWDSVEFSLMESECDYSLLCMHELFSELVPPEQSDYSLEETLDRINTDLDAVALGDYHGPSSSKIDGVRTFYAGSTERMSANEGPPTVRTIDKSKNGLQTSVHQLNSEKVPRPFYTEEISISEQTTVKDIRKKLAEISGNLSKSVVHVSLLGEKQDRISKTDVYEILDDMEVEVQHVSDKRSRNSVKQEQIETASVSDLDSKIDEQIDNISQTVETVDEIVRDQTIPKNKIEEKVSDVIQGGTNES
jgi:DNA repair exonuclease SbcCD nuclease subunit